MIKTFKRKDNLAERIFNEETQVKFQPKLAYKTKVKLDSLDEAMSLDELSAVNGNRLKKLGGNRKGQFSIRINQKWRICFQWKDGEAYDVEIVDYHT